MKFTDFTIVAGQIHSRRLQDTTALAPHAVATTDRMLCELRTGVERVPHGVAGLPPFEVLLGPPLREQLAASDDVTQRRLAHRMTAPGRFFACAIPGDEVPFNLSLVLPAGVPPGRQESDRYAIATLLGLAVGHTDALMQAGEHGLHGGDPDAFTPTMQAMWAARPFLATTLLPLDVSLPLMRTIQVAADFTTCFAASLLRSPR